MLFNPFKRGKPKRKERDRGKKVETTIALTEENLMSRAEQSTPGRSTGGNNQGRGNRTKNRRSKTRKERTKKERKENEKKAKIES